MCLTITGNEINLNVPPVAVCLFQVPEKYQEDLLKNCSKKRGFGLSALMLFSTRLQFSTFGLQFFGRLIFEIYVSACKTITFFTSCSFRILNRVIGQQFNEFIYFQFLVRGNKKS